MKKQERKIEKCRCPRCKYVWTPRVARPKACPECKLRLGWYFGKNPSKKKEA